MGKKKKKKKVYRVKHWDNIDPVKFLDVSTQTPMFPGIDRLGKLFFGEQFFDDLICSLFTVYDMEGRRFLVFHLKGSKRYLLCRFRMKILNKLKKNIFTAYDVFTRFTKERFMIENFSPSNYHDDEIVNEISSYTEWLLYNFPEFDIIKNIRIREQDINAENEVNQLVEEKRVFKAYKDVNIDEVYFSNLTYLSDLKLYEVYLSYDEPIIFSLVDDNNNLFLCVTLNWHVKEYVPSAEDKNFYEFILISITKEDLDNLLLKPILISDYLSQNLNSNIYLLIDQGTGIVTEKINFKDISESALNSLKIKLEFF